MNGILTMFGISEQELNKVMNSTRELEKTVEEYQKSNLEKLETKKENA